MTTPRPIDFALTRRAFLGRYAGGLGSLALASLLADDGRAAPPADASDPLAPKPPHHPGKAKAVICLFQHGGPSQVDLFDPKPELTRRHGQPTLARSRSTSTPRPASCSPRRSSSGAAAGRGWTCPSCCRTPPGSWTTLPSSAQ